MTFHAKKNSQKPLAVFVIMNVDELISTPQNIKE